jgi:hypothetical protein
LVAVLAAAGQAPAGRPHVIRVVDERTGRGVPLVSLETTDGTKHWTDSNGVVAFNEQGLMGKRVWFNVKSTGYECPTEFFGVKGASVETTEGGKTELKLRRQNIAERLYRITGVGVYRDSVMAGLPVPVKRPVINGEVTGQDSVQCLEYRGKLWWFWGDTGRVGGPLGHFGMAGAVSDMPGKGGLDPAVGVDLEYFVDKGGFSRPMMDVPGDGAKWASGMMVVKDNAGRERMVCGYVRVPGLAPPLERALAIYNDEREVFERWKELKLDAPLYPDGQPVRVTDGGVEYFYFPAPYAVTRVRADWASVGDVGQYEAFTCLKAGTRYEKEKTRLDRDRDGKLVWGWKRDTAPLRESEQKDLINAGVMKEGEGWYRLKDVETGKAVTAHGGSVAWNAYRKKWVMLFVEILGKESMVGEVWYAESDRPEGPYTAARKVATHEKMDFYNPVHHPMFDQQGGRVIYFEGTYVNTFSGNPEATPRYNYNQLMYRLDLADPRLKLDRK